MYYNDHQPAHFYARYAEHQAVREAVVVAREEDGRPKRLVAYLVAEGEEAPDVRMLRHFLQQRVPAYMVPSAFVFLEALPLTPNGKIDRAALPVPEAPTPTTRYVAPRTRSEALLATIWEEVLGLEQVGVHDNFFELGGHSLLATQLI